jgi:hypothetical protein
MTRGARLGIAILVALAGALVIACQNGVTGPSLTATVQDVTLVPTLTGVPAGENVCCCHLSGSVKNTSSIRVHVQLRFPARNKTGQAVGVGVDLQRDIPAEGTRSFLAVGIQAPCSTIEKSQIVADQQVRVIGLWEPVQ